MVEWHHRLNGRGREFAQTPGDGEGQESLACCSPWGGKESDITWRLSNRLSDIPHTCSEIPHLLAFLGLFVQSGLLAHLCPFKSYSSLRVYGSLQLPEVLTASGLGAVVSTQLELKRLGLTHGPTPVWDKQGNKEAAWVRFPRATPYGGRDSVNPNWKKLILRSFNKWALKWTDLLIIRVDF